MAAWVVFRVKIEPDLAALGVALREATVAGRLGPAFLGAWPALNSQEPAWRDLLDEITQTAARLHPSVGVATSVHPGALGVALVDRHGRARRSDQRFTDWIGDASASPACARLASQAWRIGRCIGLVTGDDGRVVTIFAARCDLAGPWGPIAGELSPACKPRDQILLIAFAPSNSSAMIGRAAASLGLSPLEARLAESMLDAPNLEVAARSIGVGRETAKDALGSAMRKAGVASASQLVGRIVDLSCEGLGGEGPDIDLLRHAMDLSPSEARVAAALAAGGTAKQIGASLGLSPQTVKSYRRAVFQKVGVNRSRDLQRLMSELAELARLSSASQVLADERHAQERLRVVASRGRRIAFTDYGPASGTPLMVGHGFTTGRLLASPLLKRYRAAGFRVLIPQRPGFGLTDVAEGEYLETAADDLADILDRLDIERIRVLVRDGGVASLLAFDVRHPGRLDRPVLLNPRPPRAARRAPPAPMSAISRVLLERPALIAPFAEMLRRQTRSDILEGILKRACTLAVDSAAIEALGVLPQLVRDAQGLMARSIRGFIDEQHVYSHGWTPPATVSTRGWTLAMSGALCGEPDISPWAGLPDLRCVVIEGAGLMVAYSHAEQVLALLA
jgi:pimeloyl-ACP methyl ester carboxylesterase/DNA-binding CsgD family transcriptional regulator